MSTRRASSRSARPPSSSCSGRRRSSSTGSAPRPASARSRVRRGPSATSAPASIWSSSRASRSGGSASGVACRRMATDREIVARQIGREPRAFSRVVLRCPFGRPAVTEQRPYDPHGEPFPTTYYVTCRHLVQAISRLEAAGGVDRWTQAAHDDAELRQSRAAGDDAQRRIRTDLAAGATGRDGGASLELGVGGAAAGAGSLKCLHAHAAFALANPGTYELGERIVAELDPLWPTRCCMDGG